MSNVSNELWRWSAAEAASQIAKREVSSVEVVASSLARLDAVNPSINAVVDVLAYEAMQAAADADAALARGELLGPLHGVPVTVKVNVDMAGRATTNGVVAFQDTVASVDSPVVANLRKAGAVIIGRTNTPAFSLRWFTDNDLHGRTLNPWNASHTPGGSSGGASAAVAAGIGAIAHGNDQGGSIRYPAYACGVAGLRPTQGLVPAFNPSQLRERTMGAQLSSVQGPLARTVRDLRLALTAMAAPDSRDPWQASASVGSDHKTFPTRVAVCATLPGFTADEAVAAAVRQAARWLEDAGCVIEEVVPPRLQEATDLWLALTMNELAAGLGDIIERDGDDAVRAAIGTQRRQTASLDLAGYMNALARRTTLLREWQQFFERYPLLLMPVSWQRPFLIDADRQGSDAARHILDAQSPMLATAILGLPGLSVPTGLAGGLPMGVQLVAGRFQESLILSAGEAIEARCGVMTPIDPQTSAAR
ncbi:MAG: amidase [Burkholderiaceae bacterium]|uniref:Amidase n=2 Tax=Pseudomonadota TaxID=1224 RepID=A0A2L0XBM4_9BURK|nr:MULTISPECIES: amidase family protein [Cupriavidus]AVA37502.1 amidase [Cupriavidus metallidurans]KWR85884.1 amidase [Cupriavidus sp. SHE]PCH57617.1 MAG: amidase [Burkholderiaceae bacterium]QBP11510.1 amidase [Cupriavidus metallidurans]